MHADVTLSEVAKAAGVSLATASRVLNGSTRTVGADLAQRVLATADRLNYSPNAAAQAMVRGHLDVVGVVVHDIADLYFSAVASGVMRTAAERGLLVAMSSTLHRPERDAEYVAAFRRQRARAVILVGSRTTDQAELARLRAEIERFEASGGRVAAVSQRKLPVDTVAIENKAGARALATALVEFGYRRFAVLSGPSTLLTVLDRLNGFRAGLAEAGIELPADRVIAGEFTRDGGYQAMTELLTRLDEIDCVFAVNDVMAVGAMAALRANDVRLPEDIAVAGFDDIETLRDVTPPLTTVRVDLETLGHTALELALDETATTPRVRRARGTVVLRESTPRRGR